MRRSVDLPQPDGPMSETNSPAPIRSAMSSSAVTWAPPSPNTLPTPRASTTGRAEVVVAAPVSVASTVIGPSEDGSGGTIPAAHEECLAQPDQADEAEPDERAHHDRGPQSGRSARVV